MKSQNYTVFLILSLIHTLFAANQQPITTIFAPGFTAQKGIKTIYFPAFSQNTNLTEITTFPDQLPAQGYTNQMIVKICQFFGKENVNLECFMGQGKDIDVLHQIAEPLESNKTPFIIYAMSKSGAATINYVAQDNPEQLKALIIESTPADMLQAIRAKTVWLGLSPSWNKALFRTCFPNYPVNPTPPIDIIANIKNKNLPILILHSKNDLVIPFSHGLQLYTTFKKHGFNNVHFVSLQGSHKDVMHDDQTEYLTAVHTFYKHYDFQYNSLYATGNIQNYYYDITQAEREIQTHQDLVEIKTKAAGEDILLISSVSLAVLIAWYFYRNKVSSF